MTLTIATAYSLDNEYKEYFLSLGLRFLYKLLHRSTYKERRKLIAGGIYTDFDFFVQAAAHYPPSEAIMNFADGEAHLEFCGDDRNGPNEAWLWSNDYTNLWHPSDGSREDLREWGSCMWDSRRLSDWGIIQKPYDEADSIPRDKAIMIEHKRNIKEALRTENRRSDVWMNGGCGYWTEDESSIVWHKQRKISQSMLPALRTSAEIEAT